MGQLQPMFDYNTACAAHESSVPEDFNFGRDVIDFYAKDPHQNALIWCDDKGNERLLSYSDISRASNRVANYLRSRSVEKGDRVIVMLPRIPEWQICMIACLKLGAIPLPCITMLTEKDVHYRVHHAAAVAAITLTSECEKFASCNDALHTGLSIGGSHGRWEDYALTGSFAETFECSSMQRLEPAIMYYTSGSTGQPKGVCHPAQSLFTWRHSARYWLSLTDHDVMWCTADTGWSKAGTSILFGPWSQGSAVLFYDGPYDPVKRFELLSKYKVTVFCAAATEIRQLLLGPADHYDLSALRLSVSAGESVYPEIIGAWEQLTGVPLLDGYGQTETLMTVLNYPGMPVKAGSMGRPLPGIGTGILRESGDVAGPGNEGELLIRLPNTQTMLYYWNDPQRTDRAFHKTGEVSWFKTGDNVMQDKDGYLFYLGRSDDIINSSGYRIGPQEVENALIEHPAVQESAVIGVSDKARGEIVKAFIILNEPYRPSAELILELQEHTKAVTAPYKYPRQIEFVSSLPKTVSGKIQRQLLRQHNHAVETLQSPEP